LTLGPGTPLPYELIALLGVGGMGFRGWYYVLTDRAPSAVDFQLLVFHSES
jgi:hypothetical protein